MGNKIERLDDEEIIKNISGFTRDIKEYAVDRDWVSAKRMARSLHRAIAVMEKEDKEGKEF